MIGEVVERLHQIVESASIEPDLTPADEDSQTKQRVHKCLENAQTSS